MGFLTVEASNFELSDTDLAGGWFVRELQLQRNTSGVLLGPLEVVRYTFT